MNSNEAVYWGSDTHRNVEAVKVDAIPTHGHEQSINVRIPPLGVVYLERIERQ